MTQSVLYHRQNTKELCHPPTLPFAYSNWTSSTLKFSLFWDVTQCRLVVVPEQSMGSICKGTLRDVSEQRRPPIHSGERLKSEKFHIHTHTRARTHTHTHTHKISKLTVMYFTGKVFTVQTEWQPIPRRSNKHSPNLVCLTSFVKVTKFLLLSFKLSLNLKQSHRIPVGQQQT